jgi:hypothetical protein
MGFTMKKNGSDKKHPFCISLLDTLPMKTKTPSVVFTATPATIVPSGFTLGLDPGDRSHHVCVLDATGQIIREGALWRRDGSNPSVSTKQKFDFQLPS